MIASLIKTSMVMKLHNIKCKINESYQNFRATAGDELKIPISFDFKILCQILTNL